ncbi:hypothetical protein EV368DRAFT_44076 [Lentinula lateritia]|nr:hypothetical protein EV368DRAFT_44076 [Lentinula lateritia]
MDLTLEAYRLIVHNVRSRGDLAALCLVSKGFRRVAERALYNTLFMRERERTERVCRTLGGGERVARLVEALTVAVEEEGEGEGDGVSDTEETQPEERDESMELAAETETLWRAISAALKNMTGLRHLSIIIDGTRSSAYSGRLGWILGGCGFRLKSFHSDMRWDEDLVRFLNVQDGIEDLYIGDFDYDEREEGVEQRSGRLTLSAAALPRLITLECTFSEAAVAIVPGRPVARLKTCFSRTDGEGKRGEMRGLFEGLGKALARGGWYALDIADAEYEEGFAMEAAGGSLSLKGTLRYLGTLVLPVGGRERLLFYGLLMKLRNLCCVELEISAWDPSPTVVGPVAFRALGNELRLYCPGVAKIVFVSMNAGGEDIGERTTVEWIPGEGVARVESEVMNGMTGTEGLWRDV